MTPEWLKLLEYFERKSYVYNGLTIPFIVGVQRQLSGNKNFNSVDLFKQIFSNKLPNKIGLINCDKIKEYVFGNLDKETVLAQKSYSKPIYRLIGGLAINDNSFKNIDDQQVKKILIEKYTHIIENENYSKNNGEWSSFTKIDLERINEFNLIKD